MVNKETLQIEIEYMKKQEQIHFELYQQDKGAVAALEWALTQPEDDKKR